MKGLKIIFITVKPVTTGCLKDCMMVNVARLMNSLCFHALARWVLQWGTLFRTGDGHVYPDAQDMDPGLLDGYDRT